MPYLGKIVLTALTAAAFATEPIKPVVVYHGWAPHYSPGLMRKVALRRGIEPVKHMVSSPRYPIGTWLTVCGGNTGECREALVVDVSHPRDLARHLRTRREVEISGEDELLFCGHRNEPVRKCPVTVIFKAIP